MPGPARGGQHSGPTKRHGKGGHDLHRRETQGETACKTAPTYTALAGL